MDKLKRNAVTVLLAGFTLSVFLYTTFPFAKSLAQQVIYDIGCPAGYNVFAQTRNPTNEHLKAYFCLDSFGNVILPSQFNGQGLSILAFGLHNDAQWVWDATYTNGSNDLVYNNTFGSDPPFQPGDVCLPNAVQSSCKQIYCTNDPIVGASGQQSSITQLPGPNQTTTISQFLGPYHVKTTANASASNPGNGVCILGTSDDNQGPNSPATLAANAAFNACVSLIIPAQNKYGTGPGSIFITTHDFFNQDTARFCPRSAEGARGGAGIIGAASPSNSYIIVAPTINTSTFTHGVSGHSGLLTVYDGQNFQNFTLWGAGESGTTGGGRAVNLIEIGRGATSGNGTVQNVFLLGFWGGDASVKGLLFNGGGVSFVNVHVDGFGGTPVTIAGQMLAGWTSGYIGDSVNTSITVSNLAVATFHSVFAGPANSSSNGCVLNINAGGTVHDFGGTYSLFGGGTTGSAAACVGGSLDAHGTKFDVTGASSSFAVDVLSGGVADLEDATTLAPAAGSDGILNNAGGTFINHGGNHINGTTPYAGTGTGIAQAGGEAGTVTCATSAATITFKNTNYINVPIVVIQDRTTAGVVTQTSISTASEVVGCPGATDVLNYQVTPNPI